MEKVIVYACGMCYEFCSMLFVGERITTVVKCQMHYMWTLTHMKATFERNICAKNAINPMPELEKINVLWTVSIF